MKKNLFIYILLITMLFSCKPQENFNYMKNIEDVAVNTSLQKSQNTIQVGDQLVIMVTAKDMDVVKPFNQNYSSSEVVQPNQPGGNTGMVASQTAGPIYVVDDQGDIDFPVIGKINTVGKTTTELKDILRNKVAHYVINPTVSLRLTNFKITVLGEVNRQGDYTISNGNATLLNALGLAGDLTIYGKRDNILVVRNVDGIITKERVNISDANFFNSPYFYLKQGDVIYVSANETREKTSRLDPNAGIYISVASIVVTILALVFKK